MVIKYILIWLFIFIVGSLIVNFLIAPKSFEDFKENMGRVIPDKLINTLKNGINIQEENLILLKGDQLMYPCSAIGSDKKEVCQFRCGIENMEYKKYKCVKDALDCYCIK